MMRHQTGSYNIATLISGYTRGQIDHVQVCVPSVGHFKVFGHVCYECGYVNVNRTLAPSDKVEEEIFNRESVNIFLL